MRVIFPLLLIFVAFNIFAAPLENGYTLAPKAADSPEEKAKAYFDARQRVIEAAKKYEGTPYRYGGITARGLDCSGLLYLVFKEILGVTLPRSASGLYSWAEKITIDKVQPGDLLFFKTDKSGKITHVALYLGERRFIHSASSGPKTGVIYSSLDEKYWANSFAGAGRAFPEIVLINKFDNNSMIGNSSPGGKGSKTGAGKNVSSKLGGKETRILAGVAFAPIWTGFLLEGNLFRGFASQLCLNADVYPLGLRMIFGLEVRPEYDGALGVFRLPLTLSWGPNEKIKFFAGPVLSFGDASLSVNGDQRHYSGGTSWFGAVGFTAAPFVFNYSKGEIAPYIEAAWQSYSSDNADINIAADLSASFRFSTGIRWLIKVL